jgi:AraC-like DNA-binding protein
MHDNITKRKKEGFLGEKAIIMPRGILSSQCEKNAVSSPLYITDIGYYPKAKFHYRERPAGADQHILINCTEGKGLIKIANTIYNVQANDFVIIPSHTPHCYNANENDPWTIYWIHFKGSVSDAIVALTLKQAGGHKGFANHVEDRSSLFNNMYRRLERGYKSENLTYVNMSLWQYLTTFIFLDNLNTSEISAKSQLIDKAIDYMTKNTERLISLEDMAKTVNISACHFSSLFKSKTGFSPIEYFNHLKVQKACQYLLFSDLRIKEIAYKLGINDPYYFSRLFSKVMGVSPNEYRMRTKIASKQAGLE